MPMQELVSYDFQEKVLDAPGYVVVDVWAEWCGPCKMVAPILNQLADENAEKAAWYKLDADANPDTVAKYGVVSIPTLFVFKDGDVVHSVKGAKPKPGLLQEFEFFLGTAE